MNFEDKLKNITAEAHAEEQLEKEKSIQRAMNLEAQRNITLELKSIIETQFETIMKYYPNASYEKTHTIKDGEIVAIMGVFECCFLEFTKNDTYSIKNPSIICFRIFPEDDENFKLISLTLTNTENSSNPYYEFLRKSKRINPFYSGSLDKELIIEKVQEQLISSIEEIKSAY
ncbi:TPA: hypothetical protein SOL98_001194 [Clostridioides difficile]|uniref:hypothetical protein n=3 Tax=Clostridioides difficile TaxID=1496 RepID=UPI00093C59BE|nr:hypothetical protein [Clostridioides difficile]EIS9525003.1 hypothetical protein [Clostridioides difficile]EIS9624588.1 hypothetical protein [Clostridioides difficile]MBH7395228.1 hypothetical protein [Clostridioides difficile]MBY1378798.1 hypothetical protein [Clostridioides difficile]MCI4263521.1 hypothetical protein [Clostridioides difficile]